MEIDLVSAKDVKIRSYSITNRIAQLEKKICSECGSRNINPSLTESKYAYGKFRKYYLCDNCDTIGKIIDIQKVEH
jgi:uncharacterized protein with PIN domain